MYSTARTYVRAASGCLTSVLKSTDFHGGTTVGWWLPDYRGIVSAETDSSGNLKVNEATGKLDKFFESPEFGNIQGITFSDDNAFMFISDYLGSIFKLDMKTKKLTTITCSVDASIKGIDGFNFYKGTLIGIQNGTVPLKAVQFLLNKDYTSIIDFKTIDRSHPAFNEPTLGTIEGNTFYYIANSQWSGYDDNHKIKPTDQLQDIVILKVDLDKLKK